MEIFVTCSNILLNLYLQNFSSGNGLTLQQSRHWFSPSAVNERCCFSCSRASFLASTASLLGRHDSQNHNVPFLAISEDYMIDLPLWSCRKQLSSFLNHSSMCWLFNCAHALRDYSLCNRNAEKVRSLWPQVSKCKVPGTVYLFGHHHLALHGKSQSICE